MAYKRNNIILHILAWAVCFSIPILIYNNPYGEYVASTNEKFGVPEIINYSLFIVFFYLNAFLFIPEYFSKKRITEYVIFVVLVILAIGTINTLISQEYRPHIPPRPFIRVFLYRLFIGLANLAISTSYRMILDNLKREREIKEKEKENLIAELSFLRSQISPHFVFNVLNSVVSLARKKSDQLEPVLMELSNLMRYMLYESDSEKVSVKKMVMYLNSYINLQKMRFNDDVKIDYKVIDNSSKDNYIEPMLFIPLVENAFKHGIGIIEEPEINVLLTVNEKSIVLHVQNKFNKNTTIEKEKKSGIGLNNLKRRLNLLYPETHELIITEKENNFYTNLNLTIQ